MIYLACPYSHDDPAIRALRFRVVTQFASKLMMDGFSIFSPITHCHPIAEFGDLPTSWFYWRKYDREMIEMCDSIMVLMLPGWKELIENDNSDRFSENIRLSKELNKSIQYIDPYLRGLDIPELLLNP
ncbi:DUF1937 family protein [candidate division KSB1 bacterium]|nr:DUF1937 family protein [candidate division KSB1 bacterium]